MHRDRYPSPRAAAALGWVLGLWAAGCSNPAVVENEGPPVLAANEVRWETAVPCLGWVRYGIVRGAFQALAFPSAEGREDKRYETQHRVRLLGVHAKDVLFLQPMGETAEGDTLAGEILRVRADKTQPGEVLTWTMIDVGFGDAHLLTTPTTGTRILIDAGERRDWPAVEAFLSARGLARLDVVLATHVHVDHVGGLIGESGIPDDGVLGVHDVGVFLDGPDKSAPRAAYQELLELCARRGIRVDTVRAGDTDYTHPGLAWDPAVRVEVLNAGYGRTLGGTTENDFLNNDSIVLRLTFGSVSLFLGGDAEAPVENALVTTRGAAIGAEVLKIHHHGVNDASTPGFLDAVDPRVGLIPVASVEMPYHSVPGRTLLERLHARHIATVASDRAEALGVPRSDATGHHVIVLTDGQGYEIRIEPSASPRFPFEASPLISGWPGP